jgi:3-phenylpropionate/trans-cinnamate dioxygenase ferredoxin reductase subunit
MGERMGDEQAIVIIGAGLAGDTAAGELREVGWAGRIIVVGDEPERPYDRPPLSKGVLVSEAEEEKTYFHPAEWYADKNIELKLDNPCVSIDAAGHQITLKSGEVIRYAKLLLCTGAGARRLPLLETGAVPVYYLRSLADARKLRAELVPGAKVVVIGGGVIGMEVAASSVLRGCTVTVIEGLERIMARVVSSRVSEFLSGYHGTKGAKILVGAKLAATQDEKGKVLLDDGTAIPADLVIVGIGASPNVDLARAAGLEVRDGILVDRRTRTSNPDIHAAGDVTQFEHGEGYARAEHWRHAIDQATVAARVMAGAEVDYAEDPWLWSDQYELNIQVTGEGHGDTEVLRGSLDDNAFILFHLRDGHVVGATSINQGKHKRAIASLVTSRATVEPEKLADPSVDLKKLAASLAAAA